MDGSVQPIISPKEGSDKDSTLQKKETKNVLHPNLSKMLLANAHQKFSNSNVLDPKYSQDKGSLDPLELESSTDSLNFLFHISDIDTPYDKRGNLKTNIKKKLGVLPKLSYTEFEWELKRICNCCLKHVKDLHELHLKRSAAMDMIDNVLTRMDVNYFKTHHIVHLVWSMMSIMHHFQLRFRSGTKSVVAWTRKKKVRECMETYIRLINTFPKSAYRLVLNAMLVFYKEGKLWTIEFRLTEMICNLLYMYTDIEEAIEDILVTAENSSLSSDLEPRMLIKVLSEVLASVRWGYISEKLIRRFLKMFRKSIVPNINHPYRYGPMRTGLTISLRNITKNLNNRDLMNLLVIIVGKITFLEMEDDTLIEFGGIGEYAALRYHTQKYSESIPENLMENIMTMMLSDNSYHHLFAHRIIQNIMDRHENRMQFEYPRIFFRGVNYNIKIAKYSARDRQYYKRHRLDIYHVLMAGLQHHYHSKINLDSIYTYLAITCVEIPCSYVASSIVSFAMAMQEFILQTNPPNMVSCHHVHAMVMSLMSLVCYVHKAEIFYNYVTLIMERRSEIAPHLNPPVKVVYKYAQHHILWNKPDLFFEDWEARYGLWKCFRTSTVPKKKQLDSRIDLHSNTKILI